MTIYGKDKPVFKFRDEVKTYISINKFMNISIFRSVKEIKKKIEKISGEQKTKFEYLIKTPDNINDYSINDLYDKNFIESHPIFNDFDVENEKKD